MPALSPKNLPQRTRRNRIWTRGNEIPKVRASSVCFVVPNSIPQYFRLVKIFYRFLFLQKPYLCSGQKQRKSDRTIPCECEKWLSDRTKSLKAPWPILSYEVRQCTIYNSIYHKLCRLVCSKKAHRAESMVFQKTQPARSQPSAVACRQNLWFVQFKQFNKNPVSVSAKKVRCYIFCAAAVWLSYCAYCAKISSRWV